MENKIDCKSASVLPIRGGNANSDKECSICNKHFPSSFFMNLEECGHTVCKVCIYDWNKETESQTCPVCKSVISQRQQDLMCSNIQYEDNLLKEVHYEKIYISAGGILVRRVNDIFYYLAVQQRECNGDLQWVSPKGRLEGTETSLEAAHREISEEVGLKSLSLIDFISQDCYSFRQSGKLYKKTVFWYLFEVNQPSELVLNEEEGFIKSKWITYEDSINTFTHNSFIKIIKVVNSVLKKY